MSTTKRCFGNGIGKEFYADYHDKQWGVPVHDDQLLFEMLILEGAQAGLSWETILKRKRGYQKAFHTFDPKKNLAHSDYLVKNTRIPQCFCYRKSLCITRSQPAKPCDSLSRTKFICEWNPIIN